MAGGERATHPLGLPNSEARPRHPCLHSAVVGVPVILSKGLVVRGEVLQCCDVIGAVVEFMVSAALSVRVKSFSVVTSSGRW